MKNGWRLRVLYGEAGGVDKDAIADKISDLCKVVAEYDPENVYNMDETGLFFKCLPNNSYINTKGHQRSQRDQTHESQGSCNYFCDNQYHWKQLGTTQLDWKIKEAKMLLQPHFEAQILRPE